MAIFKRISVSILVLIVLCISINRNASAQEIAAFSTQLDSGSQIARFDIYTHKNKDMYLSGEEIILYVGIGLSDDSGLLIDSILEVKIPKDYIIDASFEASEVNNQKNKEVIDDGNYYIVRYLFQPLSSGITVDVPIKFKTNSSETPNGYKIPITASLKDSNGENMLSSINKEYTIETQEPVVSKTIKADRWLETDNNTVSAGREDPAKPGYLSTNLNNLDYVDFSFILRQTGKSEWELGRRDYDKFIVKDTIPEGAVFVAEANPGWEFDPITRIATFVYEPNRLTLSEFDFSSSVKLRLKFPGQPMKHDFTNTVSVESFPKDKPSYESTYISEDSIIFDLTTSSDPVPTGPYYAYKSISESQAILFDIPRDRNKIIEWKLGVEFLSSATNDSSIKLEKVTISDNVLAKELMYHGVQFDAMKIPVGTVNITVTYDDNSEEIVAKNIDVSSGPRVVFKDPQRIKKVDVSFSEGTYITTSMKFEILLLTEFRNKEANVLNTSESSRWMKNSATFTGTYSNGIEYNMERSKTIKINKIQEYLSIKKSTIKDKKTYFINDIVDYRLSVNAHEFVGNYTVAETNKIVDIMPVGFEYVPGSSEMILAKRDQMTSDLHDMESMLEPEVVLNYQGTGRTALIWELKPFTMTYQDYISVHNGVIKITYSARITEYARQGENTNDVYLSWLNNDIITPYKGRDAVETDDIFDLNGDGSVTDKISYSAVSVNYAPPKELIVRKLAKGSLDSVYQLPPASGTSEIGRPSSYRLQLYNNSIADITTVHILDTFPMIGDKTVSIDLAQSIPGRVDRNSTFSLILSGPIVVPNGYKVMYTNDDPLSVSDMSLYYQNADWKSEMSDYSRVKAVRIELMDGFVLAIGEEINIDINFDVPFDTAIHREDVAVNSFGVAVSKSLDFAESNLAYIKTEAYLVSGKVFVDLDKDGVCNNLDSGIKSYLVELVDVDGNPVLDGNGNVIQTHTDADGNYRFKVYHNGIYRVRVRTPRNLELTQTMNIDVVNGSHITDSTLAMTDPFVVDVNHKEVIRNAGYFQVLRDITVTKHWIGGEGLRGDIQVQLYRNGSKIGSPVTISYPNTQNTWYGLEYADVNGNPYTYSVDELEVPTGFDKTVSGFEITNTFIVKPTPEKPGPELPSTGEFNILREVSLALSAIGAVMILIAYRKRQKQDIK